MALNAEFRDAFSLFDKDGDGQIDATELGQILNKLGHPSEPEDVKKMIEAVDKTGKGTIGFDAFQGMMTQKWRESEIKATFAAFDRDGNGYISKDELRLVMNSLGEHLSEGQIQSMIEAADANHDGQIEYAEFLSF